MTPVTLSLEAHLLSYNKQALIRFMGFLPKTGADPSRKDELVEHIQAELLSIDGLRHVWAELTELEQQALVAAVNDPATPGQLDRRAFQAQHGKLPERSAERSGERVYFSDRSAQHPAMFFTADYAIPGDLVEALRKIIPSPSPYRLPALETLPTTVRGRADGGREANVALTQVRTEPHAFHDLVATLRLIEGGKLKVSASTLAPGALAVRALNDALAQPDYASMPSTEEGRSSSAIRPV